MPWIPLFRSFLFASLLLCFIASSSADTLKITSTPPGATVELDGITLGATPFEKDFPGGYFRRTHTAIGQRLEHPMIARLSLPGYATREIALTVGPMNWIDLHGHNHGEYWLIKSDQFHADLELISAAFTGTVAAVSSAQPAAFQLDLSLEEIVKRAKPAVVCLKGLNTLGSGFFVTATGVIATNAHVARGDSTLLALLPDNVQLQARVVYIDADLDIALVKADPRRPTTPFPTSFSLTSPPSSRANPSSQLVIPVTPCFSALQRESSALSENFPPSAPAHGFKPTPPSIPAIPVGRF